MNRGDFGMNTSEGVPVQQVARTLLGIRNYNFNLSNVEEDVEEEEIEEPAVVPQEDHHDKKPGAGAASEQDLRDSLAQQRSDPAGDNAEMQIDVPSFQDPEIMETDKSALTKEQPLSDEEMQVVQQADAAEFSGTKQG